MQFRLRHIFLTALLVMLSCTKEGVTGGPALSSPEAVSLSVGIDDASSFTKAITVKPEDAGRLGELPSGTSIFMVMKSQRGGTDGEVKYSVTEGVTGTADQVSRISPIDFSREGCTRYWEDAFSRDGVLSVYAACSPGRTSTISIGGRSDYTHTTFPTSDAWSTEANSLNISDWRVSSDQTAETIRDEDLCYSNNISIHADGSGTDQRLKFIPTDPAVPHIGKFEKGHLCFRHALSKITINVRMGEGFTEEEFRFNPGTNIRLNNFYTSNSVFDIPTGEFTGEYSVSPVSTMALRATPEAGAVFTLDALVMPATDLSSEVKGDISLVIANNLYDISKAELLQKISEDDRTAYLDGGSRLKPGVHYVFTFIIGKTKIDKIDASVVDWESIETDPMSPSNARIRLMLEERGNDLQDDEKMNFFRAQDKAPQITDTYESYDWAGGYAGNANLFCKSGGSWTLADLWFWPDNMTYYHFRGVVPQTKEVATDASGRDFISLDSAVDYIDARWGAPMRDTADNPTPEDFKFTYTPENGFDNLIEGTDLRQIYQAIGPTEDRIRLTLFHAMSEVNFTLTTTDGDDRVEIGSGENGTRVQIEGLYTQGCLLLGTGKVETSGSRGNLLVSDGVTALSNSCSAGIVPQDLSSVKLTITTPDHNNYIIDLGSIKVSAEPSTVNVRNPYIQTDGKWTIDSWRPGFRYRYTFRLRKKGVTEVSATVLGWEGIEAGDDDVQIQ